MSIRLSDDIRTALEAGGPVVALETAVLTTGLPRSYWSEQYGDRPSMINTDIPINLAAAKAMTNAVNTAGGVPAWIAVLNGSLRIGLSDQEVEDLALDETAGKVSLANFASEIFNKKSAGTTVASTLHACSLAESLCSRRISVFATGGIGGMHLNWSSHFDVSADLRSLATTRTCVVASGAKTILDLPATVESLEALGVPIIGFKTNRFPCFVEDGSEDDPIITSADTPKDIAKICHLHWEQLGATSSVLATSPVPQDVAIPRGSLKKIITESDSNWVKGRDIGATRTPALLEALAIHTHGRSLVANLALLCNNAKLAAEISVAMSS